MPTDGGDRYEPRAAFPVVERPALRAVRASKRKVRSRPPSIRSVRRVGEPSPSNGALRRALGVGAVVDQREGRVGDLVALAAGEQRAPALHGVGRQHRADEADERGGHERVEHDRAAAALRLAGADQGQRALGGLAADGLGVEHRRVAPDSHPERRSSDRRPRPRRPTRTPRRRSTRRTPRSLASWRARPSTPSPRRRRSRPGRPPRGRAPRARSPAPAPPSARWTSARARATRRRRPASPRTPRAARRTRPGRRRRPPRRPPARSPPRPPRPGRCRRRSRCARRRTRARRRRGRRRR